MGQDKVTGNIFFLKLKGHEGRGANTNLRPQAKPIIKVAQAQRMQEPSLVKIHISASLGFQQAKRTGSGTPWPQEIAGKIRTIQALSIDKSPSMEWSFAGVGRQWGSAIRTLARLQPTQLISIGIAPVLDGFSKASKDQQ